MKFTAFVSSSVFAFWSGIAAFAADPLDTWTLRNPAPTPNNLRAIASGNGILAAVGPSGTIVTSADGGDTWTERDSGSTNLNLNLTSIAYGNGQFIAVPELGQLQSVITSTNGTNWALTSTTFSNNFFTAITFGGGSFVLLGYGGATNIILTSSNGVSWTTRPSGVTNIFTAVTYAQNQFVAVGGTQFPTNRGFIITSPDGITWTTRRTNVPALYTSVAGNASGFVAVGNQLTSRSANGVSWTDTTDVVAGRNAVAASTNLFVSTDTVGGVNDYSVFYSSPDGAAWTNRGTAGSIRAITWSSGRFIAVGAANDPFVSPLGTHPSFYVSDDGISWRSRYLGLRGGSDLSRGAAYGNGTFVAILTNSISQGSAFVSTNGIDWLGNLFNNHISQTPGGLTFGAGLFVAVGGYAFSDGTLITTSANGTNWTDRHTSSIGPLTSVAYSGSQFVAVGRRSLGERPVLTSPNGITWTPQLTGISNDLFSVTYGSGAFVAVGAAGNVARSTDGVNWTKQSITPSNHLRSVTFASSLFVAAGDAGTIFTSPDGSTWTRRTSGTARDLNVATWFSNRFLAGGDAGALLISADGINWSNADSGTDFAIQGAAASPNLLLLTGAAGLVETSPNGTNWTQRSISAGNDTLLRKVLAVEDRILGFSGSAQVRSTTGRSWANWLVGAFTAGNDALYTNGLLITVGTDELGQPTRISVSTNRGDSFTDLSFGNLGQLYGLTFANGLYVTTGDRPGGSNAVVLTSTNGLNWTFRNSNTNVALWDVAYGNSQFVAVGTTGGAKSTDGITWTPNPGAKGESMTFGAGKFVAVGAGASVSTDGITWTNTLTNAVSLENVRYASGTFVAVGPSGIYTSTNGTNWQYRFVRTQQKLNSVEFANDSFFVVGFSGTIYQSGFLTNTPATIVTGPQPQTAIAGGSATFKVNATGHLPLTYQWFKNGVPISGATDASLTLTAVGASDAANYHVIVSNETGSQTSAPAALTIASVTVSVSPELLYLFTNTAGAFTASVTGGTPVSYQWRKNSSTLTGATNATLVFPSANLTNTANYSVIVNFGYGSVISSNQGFLAVLSSLDEVTLDVDPSYQQVANSSTRQHFRPGFWTDAVELSVVQERRGDSRRDEFIAGVSQRAIYQCGRLYLFRDVHVRDFDEPVDFGVGRLFGAAAGHNGHASGLAGLDGVEVHRTDQPLLSD